MLFCVVRVAEKAFHMALPVVHAVHVSRKMIFRTVTFNTGRDFCRLERHGEPFETGSWV